jgi:mannose-6-phosphate isomerase
MIDRPLLLKNFILPYEWGSVTQIPEFLGFDENPGQPKAELWMGAHPKAPSHVYFENQWLPLDQLITLYPTELLGEHPASEFKNALPFLFKVLAIESPLSIQVHPNAEQAKKGFQKENAPENNISSEQRTYLDDQAKPEIICAYTDLSVLAGFRSPEEICRRLIDLDASGLNDHLLESNDIIDKPENWLKRFFETLMTADVDKKTVIISSAKNAAKKRLDHDPVYQWVNALANRFPEDVCILAPVFLNLIDLKPGEALFLDAGRLHCYLQGMGIELMSNSDNCVRCGLTSKKIDTDELLEIVSYETPQIMMVEANAISSAEQLYNAASENFVLSKLTISTSHPYKSSPEHSLEILLCTEGSGEIHTARSGYRMRIRKGQSILIPGSIGEYEIKGKAVIFKAGIPFKTIDGM